MKNPYTFIDLFAGIGGIRSAFDRAGCKCVFSSEWDKYSRKTYEANYGEIPCGDITKIESSHIPKHDILAAGFPCQPFSISGISKKKSLKRPHGFNDPTQGTLFFDIKRIMADRKPKAFLLENVKHIERHDKGRTFKLIMRSLENELGYSVFHKILDAQNLVPQHRERVIIVGFHQWVPFKFPEIKNKKPKIIDILDDKVDPKYTLSDKLWLYLQDYAKKHRAKGNGFGYGLVDLDGVARTLSARYYKDGSEILIPQEGKNPRRLTPRECSRLMGFPPDFKMPVSDTQAYKQFGNSVAIPIIEMVAKELVKTLKKDDKEALPEFQVIQGNNECKAPETAAA